MKYYQRKIYHQVLGKGIQVLDFITIENVRNNNYNGYVYNLDVLGNHNYYVGDACILVHNDCVKLLPAKSSISSVQTTASNQTFRYTSTSLVNSVGKESFVNAASQAFTKVKVVASVSNAINSIIGSVLNSSASNTYTGAEADTLKKG